MDIKSLILAKLSQYQQIKTSDITKDTGFSRAYVNRFFQELQEEGKVIQIGKTKNSHYTLATSNNLNGLRSGILEFKKLFVNHQLNEDSILKNVKQATGIFSSLINNVNNILEYSFLEMVNNAIEHSQSDKIQIKIIKEQNDIIFTIEDWGIGIFEYY